MTYTGRRCDHCNALIGKPHAAWCTAPRGKLDVYGLPLPGAATVPGRMSFTVLEKG